MQKVKGAKGSVVKRRKVEASSQSRTSYGTVARTRGVYAKGEMKYFDTRLFLVNVVSSDTWAGTVFDPNATVPATVNPLSLFVPTQGPAINQRIGREAHLMKIKIRGVIKTPVQGAQAAADATSSVRIQLVQDTQTNAAQMTGTQLMTSVGGDINAAMRSFQNLDNFGRFKVWKERMIVLQNPNMVGSPTAADVVQTGLAQEFKFNVVFKKPIAVRFNATSGGTVADIVDNSFHLVVNTDSGTLTPQIAYYARCAFKE